MQLPFRIGVQAPPQPAHDVAPFARSIVRADELYGIFDVL